jgi:hypothetical protein
LLKSPHEAAQVLEDGKCYAEAAVIYKIHCKNKKKAAECYEKGNMYSEAISLYKELNENEKVGDMYKLLHRKKDADNYYKLVADEYIKNLQYVKAALLFRKKMSDTVSAQDLLLEGWNTGHDAFNCLNNYFQNIQDADGVGIQIGKIYKDINDYNREMFLQVIKLEYNRFPQLQPRIKNIGYEIIASQMVQNPFIASELIFFNRADKLIVKDVMKFKGNNKSIRL